MLAIQDHPIIEDIGRWVLSKALHQIQEWKISGLHLPVSINVSAREFLSQNYSENLRSMLEKHLLVHPGDLELELLETGEIDDIETVASCMYQCRRLGVTIAIDDSGTGYSSLLYLKRLPTDVLKIDQNFVRNMLNNLGDLAIVKGVIGLAVAFNKRVVAEGIESPNLGRALITLGCSFGQGYSIAKPMAANDLLAWINGWSPSDTWGISNNDSK